jgi:hypothetical protein
MIDRSALAALGARLLALRNDALERLATADRLIA